MPWVPKLLLKKSLRAFISHDLELAKEVIENDEIVNNYETKLEKKSLEIIALQQPVSSDLRTVITALKASSDVERMGDHAVAIAKATIRIKGENRMTDIEAEIKKMGKAVRHMVEEALEVYLNADEKRERIGDYARNLCEWVVYLKSGKIIEL